MTTLDFTLNAARSAKTRRAVPLVDAHVDDLLFAVIVAGSLAAPFAAAWL